MKNLLKEWNIISSQFQMKRQVLLLCDYDGTLTPIVSHPELAELAPAMKNLLTELSRQEGIKLGIISGRGLNDLKEKVAIPDLVYAGNHGMEISGPGISYTAPVTRKMSETLGVINTAIHQQLDNISGIVIEDKGLTLSVHYRLVPDEKHRMIRNLVDSITRQNDVSGRIKITYGKKVFEIRPEIDWDKGSAVSLLAELLVKEQGLDDYLLIYLGDDSTDEDGFRAVNRFDYGISILIGKARNTSLARYYLESIAEVHEFLANLLLIISGKSH